MKVEEGVAGGGGMEGGYKKNRARFKRVTGPRKKSREREDKVEWGLRSGMKRV